MLVSSAVSAMSSPAACLSHELRRGSGDDLRRRRWVVGLSMVGVGAGAVVGLYQMGILRRLPDPPAGPFDSSRVDASSYAYKRMQTPDGLLMIATYAVTAILAGAGGSDRARRQPWLPLAMAGKAAWDVLTTLRLTREEWQENSALCAYCQAATLASLAAAALSWPEARRALGVIRGS